MKKVLAARRSKTIAALVATVAVAAALAGAVLASTPFTVTLADGTSTHFKVVSSYVADGVDTGWHMHPGLVIVQVHEGSLQVTQQLTPGGTCTSKTVNAGDTNIEPAYTPMRAVGTGEVRWTTMYLTRIEDPLAIPITTSPCP